MPIINIQRVVNLNSAGITETGDPSEQVFDTVVDLPLELSKLYSKNIRQGATFKIKGVQAAMRAANNEYDVGLASTIRFAYCPSTKHSRDAWKSVFSTWYNQKKLRAGAVGRYTRYDDLEYAYNVDHTTDRTSTLLQGGILDGDADQMVLYGSSNESSDIFSLQDHFNSLQIQPAPSRYSASGDVIKEPKFETEFPLERHFWATSEASSNVSFKTVGLDAIDSVDITHLGGSNSTADIHQLPECANALCGLLRITGWVIPDDTSLQREDEAILNIAIWVESWKNIFPTRSYRSMKNTKSSRYAKTSRYNRKSSKRKGRK